MPVFRSVSIPAVLLIIAFIYPVIIQAAVSDSDPLIEGILLDREALLALKDAAVDFGDSLLATWRPTGNPCLPIPWRHITCDNGRVQQVNLANLGISGTLPKRLSQANKLLILNLSGNRFEGKLPRHWADKTRFQSLRVLDLSNNELSGSMPNWNRKGGFRSLKQIDLSNNNFTGGLPSSWLGRHRPLRNVQYLDLSNNLLGEVNGTTLLREEWCKSEADAGMSPGTGWCPAPSNRLLPGTAASLAFLDLSNNGLTGAIPERWPRLFPALRSLMLHFNSLAKQVEIEGVAMSVPSVLPSSWTSDLRKGFPSLSLLTLYPGNEYLCSVPDLDGGFLSVNHDTTYRVIDGASTAYGNEIPRRCPAPSAEDLTPSAATLVPGSRIEWEFGSPSGSTAAEIWGFTITIWEEDREGGTWKPVNGWSGVRVRTYTFSDDGFSSWDVQAQGLACSVEVPGRCVLSFAESSVPSIQRPMVGWEVGRVRAVVATITLDGRVSSPMVSPLVQN